MRALDFAGAIGKEVRVEGPATPEQREYFGHDTVGGSGILAEVRDCPVGDGRVEVIWDYGMGWIIDDTYTIQIAEPGWADRRG